MFDTTVCSITAPNPDVTLILLSGEDHNPYKSYRSQRSPMDWTVCWAESMANKLPSTSQPESMQLDPLGSGDEVRRDRCLRPNHPGSHSSFVLSDGSVPTFLIFTQAKRLGDSAGLQWLQEGHVLICFFNLRVSSTPTVAKKSGAVLQDNTLKSLARYLGVLFH